MVANWLGPAGCILIVSVAWTSAYAAETGQEQVSGINFKGQVVLLVVDRSSALEKKSDTEYLIDAVIQKLGDRYFITGAAYSFKQRPENARHDWRKRSHVGVAWDKVQAFYVFSPEQIEEMMKKRMEEQDE